MSVAAARFLSVCHMISHCISNNMKSVAHTLNT